MEKYKGKFEVPASILLRTLTPHEGVEEASHLQICLDAETLPFLFIVDTPDPIFLEKLACELFLRAAELRENPRNLEWEGKHLYFASEDVDTSTVEVSNSPVPAAGESE